MKIEKRNPPNINEIKKVLNPDKYTVFCYGDTVYNPCGEDIPRDIMVHEEVHSKQQQDKPEVWWTKYLYDTEFRLNQEIEAYATQLKWIKEQIPKAYKEALDEMTEQLSSPIYKVNKTRSQLETLIRKKLKCL